MISMPLKPDPPAARLRNYADRIESDLLANVLPFWLRHASAANDPAFIGELSHGLVPNPFAERGLLLTARILWTFSAAHQRYARPEFLTMANRAHRDLQSGFWDAAHGGYWWALRPDGTVSRDRKQVYGQAFALYALAEYHAATGRPEVLDEAVAVFELLETRARDPLHGGYTEAFDRTWRPIADLRLSVIDLNAPKSQNTHLHVLEAYTALFRVWPDVRLQRALRDLAGLFLARITDPFTGLLRLFFSRDWRPASDAVSYGHNIEAVWLLTAAVETLADDSLLAQLRPWVAKVAHATLATGMDRDGGLFYQGDSTGPTDRRKEWWAQAEAVVGFLEAARLGGDRHHVAAALQVWDFIEDRLIDRTHGEWRWGLDHDGRPSTEPKIGFWKCPYHNGRAALEATRRLRALADISP
jgi:mannobiose 2-epimerase